VTVVYEMCYAGWGQAAEIAKRATETRQTSQHSYNRPGMLMNSRTSSHLC